MIARSLGSMLLAIAAPAAAQHEHHAPAPPDPHAGHRMDAPADKPDAGHKRQDTAGPAPPPAPPADRWSDRYFGADAMARSLAQSRAEHGGMRLSRILLNLAEVQVRDGRDGYRWDGEGWYGGDIDRLVVKSEGEGAFGGRTEQAELQALYSRAIGPYFDLQAGLRQDFPRGRARSYAVIGVEGLAPYWFDAEATLFLSDKGDLLGRLSLTYDQRVTQRLVLQPRAELNLAAQHVPAQAIGAGVSGVELGLRLRYELRREFAPYVGISWERATGRSAGYARRAGDDIGGASAVAGVRFWF